MHSLAAGDVPEVLPSAVSPSWDCLGWMTPCLSPFPGWPTSGAWVTWVAWAWPSYLCPAEPCRAGPASELSAKAVEISTETVCFLCPPSYRCWPPGHPTLTSCTEIPTPESTYQGISYGNNMMTILQMRKPNLGKKTTCLSSESHLLVTLKLRLQICWPLAPSFSLPFKFYVSVKAEAKFLLPPEISSNSLSHLDTLTICSVWHMAMVSVGDFS